MERAGNVISNNQYPRCGHLSPQTPNLIWAAQGRGKENVKDIDNDSLLICARSIGGGQMSAGDFRAVG